MEIPVKPQTIDELLWLLTIGIICLLGVACAYLIKKMMSDSREKTSWIEKALKEISTEQIRQGYQIETLQKNLNDVGQGLKTLNARQTKKR
jgi:hypothetical protein